MADLDYYKVLGVSREAKDNEIRKAYKKLARENHPDARPDDPQAREKFVQVQEAYAVLSNSEKRDQYDRFGSAFEAGGRPRTWAAGTGGVPPFDFSNIFGGKFDLGDLFSGRGQAGGFGGAGPRGPAVQPAKGQDVRLEAEIPFTVAAEGGTHDLLLQRNGKSERLSVKIPAGVDSGSVIRLTGQGEPAQPGIPAGDLLVQIKVSPHPWFRRTGCDVLIDVPISPAEAVLGAKVDVPTITDDTVVVTVPPGTSSGTKLRLREKGIVQQKTKQRGDQFVMIKIVVPLQQDDETHRLYEEIAAKTTGSPRDGLW